jgi:hypothetical protein
MKKQMLIVSTIIILAATLFALVGCGNLSPRQDQKINNQDGKIGDIETMSNSMKLELANLRNQNEMLNNKIGQMQQGMVNMQSSSDNSGIQIFSGSGGLIVAIIGLLAAVTLIIHYRGVAKLQTKTSEILAQTIAAHQDEQLEENVFQAASYTAAEETILKLMTKHKNLVAMSLKKEE